MKKELLKGLTEEQIAKASKCKNTEELIELAKKEGVTLSEEQLAAVSGGFCSDTTVYATCPKCGAKVTKQAYKQSYSYIYEEFTCPECGHKWTTKC